MINLVIFITFTLDDLLMLFDVGHSWTAQVDIISLDELCTSRIKRITKTAILTERLLYTLGARDFSCIVSGYGQVVIVTHAN